MSTQGFLVSAGIAGGIFIICLLLIMLIKCLSEKYRPGETWKRPSGILLHSTDVQEALNAQKELLSVVRSQLNESQRISFIGTNRDSSILEEPETILECPICMDLCFPPLLTCNNGHLVCATCRRKITKCALCRAKLNNNRNHVAEAMFDFLKFKCRNKGCCKIVRGSNFKRHLESCDFRSIPCVMTRNKSCNGSLFEFQDYIPHLLSVHECIELFFDQKSFTINYTFRNIHDYHLEIFWCKMGEHTFLFNSVLGTTSLSVWPSFHGTEEEATKFQVSISVPNESRVDWKIPVHSIRKTLDEIQQLAHCAIIPKPFLLDFCDKINSGPDSYALKIEFEVHNSSSHHNKINDTNA